MRTDLGVCVLRQIFPLGGDVERLPAALDRQLGEALVHLVDLVGVALLLGFPLVPAGALPAGGGELRLQRGAEGVDEREPHAVVLAVQRVGGEAPEGVAVRVAVLPPAAAGREGSVRGRA